MRRSALALVLALAAGLIVSRLAAAEDADPLARGRYLARAGNCISCHTTRDGQPYAGGVAFNTPFGILYSTNITADPATGIGRWRLADFERALRQGVRPDGQHLYPAFPYTAFTKLSDADVAALYAYFRTVAPVKAAARDNELHFPFSQRPLLRVWKGLYFDEGRLGVDGTKSPRWNRGAYLVQGLGHCSACHSPRNWMGAEKGGAQAFSGGHYADLDEDGHRIERAPVDLTPSPRGLGAWSQADLSGYLKTGACSRTRVAGAMNAVILNSTRHLSDEDIEAMTEYLRSLPASPPEGFARPAPQRLQAGALQFDIHCGTCHLPTGLGSANTGPPLVGSAIAQTAIPSSFISFVLYGPEHPRQSPSAEWRGKGWRQMPAFDQRLTDADAAALFTYVRNAWGNSAPAVSESQVGALR